MLWGQFTAELARDGEPFEDALERQAREMVVASHYEALLPLLHHLAALDLRDRPFSQMLVALLANAEVPKRTELTFARLDAAAKTLAARGDTDGEAIAMWVRGNVLLGLGEVAQAARSWRRAADLDPTTELVEDMSLANLAYASYCVNGDIDDTLRLAGSAVESARDRGQGRGEGLALVYCSHLQIMSGRFGEAERALLAADDAFAATSGDVNGDAVYEWPLAHAGLGALAALRGHAAAADTAFLRGVLLARQLENSWYEAIVRTFRADHTRALDSRRAHADCRYAIHEFDALGDQWWGAIARRVRADAALTSGEVQAAQRLALDALERLENPVERGRGLVSLSRALLAAGDPAGATARADEAVRSYEPTGAAFLLCEALLLLADCDPLQAPAAIERARSLSTADEGFTQLWASRASLTVHVLGKATVSVADAPVQFRTTRAEHLVYMLVLAGGRGVDVRQIKSALWPDAAPAKVGSNLSTATYDARQALGSEAWRLQRVGSQMWLDLDGANVDLHDAMRRARGGPDSGAADALWADGEDRLQRSKDQAAARRSLRQEILPALTFEPWVADANHRREAFVASLMSEPG